jgi:hypothetical protein
MTKSATYKLAMAKTGSNDMSHVVWALGEFFLPRVFCFILDSND